MHDDNVQIDIKIMDDVAQADTARRLELLKRLNICGSYLDFGCGDGRILEAMRPLCRVVCGVEPERRMQENLRLKNMDVYAQVKDLPAQSVFDCITLFHVLEHLPDPLGELHSLASHMRLGGKMLIEVPNANDALLTQYNVQSFMNFTYWSCHLYLFTLETLRTLLNKIGFSHISLWQVQRYGLPNHLGWIAQGRPTGLSGGEQFSWLCGEELEYAYERHLATRGYADTIIAECTL